MSTNIEKKISKSCGEDSSTVTGTPSAVLKYVDTEVFCSKTRKEQIIDTVDEAEEDQYNLQQQEREQQEPAAAACAVNEDDPDYHHFIKNIDERCLNSSALFEADSSLTDGTLADATTVNFIISKQPSPASKGLENTYKLLKNQMDGKTERTISLIKKLKSTNIRSYSDVDAKANISLSKCSDLDHEAMLRIQRIMSTRTDYDKLKRTTTTIDAPLLALLCDFVPNDLQQSDFSVQEHKYFQNALHATFPCEKSDCDCDCSCDEMEMKTAGGEILYHAAIDAKGKKCLKVLRSPGHRKVLCGNRVSQMTRAYDDIEAVTRLLEEKEKDLELTVQIGKELLTQNTNLETRVNDLENDLKSANDDRAQLLHELHKKNELISVLTNDGDDGSEAGTPNFSKSITVDLLQKKITTLQDENKSLKVEASQLASQTDAVEAHERQLMEDITVQMNEANSQFECLSLELERQREENRLQHEQIVSLTARLSEAEMRLHQLTADNDEHVSLLNITKENQNSLALELVEFKQRYQEVLALLHEAQAQLRKQRKKLMPQVRSTFMSNITAASSCLLQPESLHSELMESSMYSDNSLDSGISGDNQHINDRIGQLLSQLPGSSGGASVYGITTAGTAGGIGGQIPPYKRVFETVRCASKNGNYMDSGNVSMTQMGAMSMSSMSGTRMAAFINSHPAGSYYRSSLYEGGSHSMGVKTLSMESLGSQSDDCYPAAPSGVPGAPGAKDLEAALKRLTPAEVLARRAMLSYAPIGTYSYDEPLGGALPLGVRTPDSIMSIGSSGISSSTNMSAMMQQWRLPEKLQIVKPIEGSQTLHHWSRLATPTLSGLLEERPGVTIRGGRGLDDLGMQVYTLSDVEEDVCDDLPGKQFETTGCTYTYSTSMVMHPDDGLVNDLSFLSQSQMSSRMASASTSRQPSCPPTPRAGGLSRKNSCSTFSVNLGLASMLNERGIKAVTPSALNTPAGPNFSPTVTPCNSPEGSPTRSMSPEPLLGLFSSGADLIRRKLAGNEYGSPNRLQQNKQKIMLSRLERRALRSLKLVEKVESIGLENIISAQPNAMSQLASGIANRSSSPLSQLGSLRHINTSSNSIVDDIHFDREQIKIVLHKGLKSPLSATTDINTIDVAVTSKAKNNCSSENSRVSDNDDTYIAAITTKKNQTDNAQITTGTIQLPIETTSQLQTTAFEPPPNATDTRLKQMQRQKSRRNIKNGIAIQRQDLGTIGGGGRVRADLGKVAQPQAAAVVAATTIVKQQINQEIPSDIQQEAPQSITQSFVGTVSSLLFGRKGGWL